MKKLLGWCFAGLAAAAMLAPTPARADLSFGYASRYTAMGGAGLAVIDDPTQAAQLNPAALSLRPLQFGFQWPDFSFRARGAGIGDAIGQLATNSLSISDALKLARDFGKEPTRLEANLSFGAAMSVLDLRARSEANIQVAPGATFTRWATTGEDLGSWLGNQRDLSASLASATNVEQLDQQLTALGLNADVLGAAMVSPSIGFGVRVPNSLIGQPNLGDLRVGVRLKPVRTYYSHWVVKPDTSGVTESDFTAEGFQGYSKLGVKTVQAAELGTSNSLSDTSLAADLGLLWQPARVPYTTFALTVENMLEPKFSLPNVAGVPNAGDKLMPRTFNLGAAMQVPGNLVLAADLVDLTGARGTMQFRAGGEFRPPVPALRWLALRAGYNSGTGLSAGIGVGGFGMAFAARTPVVATQTLNF